MQLEHEFTVPVPVAQAWDVLLDVERIAPCMPGATVESFDGETIVGRVKVKVGPIQVTYAGTARFSEKDESARRAVIEAKRQGGPRQRHGQRHHHRAAARRRRVLDQRQGHDRPRDHRQAGAVRSRRHGRGRRQAARPVRRLPGRRARQRGGRRTRTGAGALAEGRDAGRRATGPQPPESAGGRPSQPPPPGRRRRRPGRRRRPRRSGARTTTPSTCWTPRVIPVLKRLAPVLVGLVAFLVLWRLVARRR